MYPKFSPKLFLAAVCLFTVAGLAQKGKPIQCTKPTVAPPDTSTHTGSGGLDLSFNRTGYAVYEQMRSLKYVSTLPDGRIIGIGEGARSTDSPTGTDILIMRFNADGSRDTTFGDVDTGNPLFKLGYTYIALTSGTEFVQSGALLSDGRMLVAGWSTGIGWVVRTLPDGTLDPSFSGGDGIYSISTSTGIWEVAIQSDEKIIFGGRDNNFNVTRLNADGSLDTSFGNAGTAVHNAGIKSGRSSLWSITFQRVATAPNEERILIGGWANTSANGTASMALMRLRTDGSADTTFGSSGKVTTSFFGTGDQARRVAVDSSNRILAAGITRINSCTATDFAIARYTQNGQLDPSFGNNGKAAFDLYNDDNSVYALTLQPDGKPIIGGNARVLATDPVNRRYYLTLVRFDTAGNLDSSFGPGTAGPGVVTTVVTGYSQSSWIFSLHQQSDGKILAAGNSIEKPALARYLP